MKVIFIKEFAGHSIGNVIDTDANTARYLVDKDICEPFIKAEVQKPEKVETKELNPEYTATVEMLKTAVVKDLPYGVMQNTVSVLGLKTNGATKDVLIAAIQDFKNKL